MLRWQWGEMQWSRLNFTQELGWARFSFYVLNGVNSRRENRAMMTSILIFWRLRVVDDPALKIQFRDKIESVNLSGKNDIGVMPNFD